MGCSPPSPTVKPTLPCSTTDSWNKSNHSKTVSFTMKKHSNEPPTATPSMMDTFPTSTSPAATDSHIQLSGSSSMMMARCRAMRTLMAPTTCPSSSTCMLSRTMPTTMKARQNLHSPFWHGSGTSWWALPLTFSYSTMPSLSTTIGGSPVRYTATTTSTSNMPTPVSNLNASKSSSMPSNWPALVPSPISNSCMLLSKWRSFKTYLVNPRPRVQHGSVSLQDVVIQTSGGVMLPALRSPARPDLPHLV